MRYIFLMGLLSLGFLGQSQVPYTPAVLQGFTDLYLEAKSIKIDTQSEFLSLLQYHKISTERYRNILQQSLQTETPELAANELDFIDALKNEKAIAESKKLVGLRSLLEQHSYNYDTYIEIENKYKTDLKFQRSLKPYFDFSLNQRRK